MKGILKPVYIVCGLLSIVILAFVVSPDLPTQEQKEQPKQEIAEGKAQEMKLNEL